MRRIGLILSLSALIVAMSTMFAFAGELELESTYPTDGQTNTSIENLGVKLYFNNDIAADDTIKANEECFAIIGEDGKEIPIRVLANPEEKGLIMVLADNTSEDLEVVENSEYELVIKGDLVDDQGNVLGNDQSVKFTTLNQSRNTMINMGMMGVMFVAIFFFSQRSMRKANRDESEEQRYEIVNPYKEAKRTGKTVEQVVEEERKKREKAEAKAAKKAAKGKKADGDDDYEEVEELPLNTYKVKAAKPISVAGGKTKSGMIAKAEEKARKEEARKKAQNYKKNSRKKK